MSKRVLIVDDEQSMCDMVAKHLKINGIESSSCLSGSDAVQVLRDEEFDAVLTDVNMPGMTGIELAQKAAEIRPDIPFIVMTAFGSIEIAIEAIRAGAFDFVTKPVEPELLLNSINRAIQHRQLHAEIKRLREDSGDFAGFGNVIGESTVMKRLYDQLERVRNSEVSILLTGESGTGKEMFARGIHTTGKRKSKPFVAVNCGALPEALIESELFGHAKGAFTDAKTAKQGLFVEADGGTLFLDEIGELPLQMQVKLLRALEERQARPVGGNKEIPFDVHVISATNRDLETAIEEGTFREDLYYRVNVLQLMLPPLRSRGVDILLLAKSFLKQFSERSESPITEIAPNAAEKLLAYSWPGNVRELRNVIERAVALARFDSITIDDLPEKILEHRDDRLTLAGENPEELSSLEDIERKYIMHVLKVVGNNKTLAAKKLGLDRKTLYRRLISYEKADSESE